MVGLRGEWEVHMLEMAAATAVIAVQVIVAAVVEREAILAPEERGGLVA
jgi:hypothetical protein